MNADSAVKDLMEHFDAATLRLCYVRGILDMASDDQSVPASVRDALYGALHLCYEAKEHLSSMDFTSIRDA